MRRLFALLLAISFAGAGCGDAPAPAPPPTAPPLSTSTPDPAPGERRSGWITGKATDTQGRPLTGVHVIIRSGSVSMGTESYYEAEVDQHGIYAQRVPGTSYAITAYTNTTYKGRRYQLWLHPADGVDSPNQDVRGGLVKDFVWQLSGPTPKAKDLPENPGSYYGGELDLGDDAEFSFTYGRGVVDPSVYPAGAKIRLQLTPDGPLLDGSAGTPLTYDLAPEKLAPAVLRDVPLGDYIARASLVAVDGSTTPLQVAAHIADGTFGAPDPGDSAAVIFMPDRMGGFGTSLVTLYLLRQ